MPQVNDRPRRCVLALLQWRRVRRSNLEVLRTIHENERAACSSLCIHLQLLRLRNPSAGDSQINWEKSSYLVALLTNLGERWIFRSVDLGRAATAIHSFPLSWAAPAEKHGSKQEHGCKSYRRVHRHPPSSRCKGKPCQNGAFTIFAGETPGTVGTVPAKVAVSMTSLVQRASRERSRRCTRRGRR